jgi:trk system potassium uptake protein
MAISHVVSHHSFWRSAGGVLLKFFASGAMLGTFLLMLPASRQQDLPLLDIFFTAVSAITVTGLTTMDTGSNYTWLGQVIIALLIQAGGLGYMLIGTITLLGKDKFVSLRRQSALGVTVQINEGLSLFSLIRFVSAFSLILVSVLTLALAVFWIPAYGWGEGLGKSAFHAVSAFNNAGFSLFPDSLMSAAGGQPMLYVHALGFILGGIGFTVIYDIAQGSRLSIHTRIMIYGSIFLLGTGTLSLLLFETGNDSLGAGSERLSQAFFQAATTRTAGFNSVDIASMSNASHVFMMINMVIGAGPGSTAGGLRLTTFVLLVAGLTAALQGRQTTRLLGRTLQVENLLRASGILILTLALLSVINLIILALEPELDAMALIFETVSALGTVGLSLGVTSSLGAPAKLLVITVMMIGKVSPVILFGALAGRRNSPLRYAGGEIATG